jgi:hypothetical protein
MTGFPNFTQQRPRKFARRYAQQIHKAVGARDRSIGAATARARSWAGARVVLIARREDHRCPKSAWLALKTMLHSVYDEVGAAAVPTQFDKLLDSISRSLPKMPPTSATPRRPAGLHHVSAAAPVPELVEQPKNASIKKSATAPTSSGSLCRCPTVFAVHKVVSNRPLAAAR